MVNSLDVCSSEYWKKRVEKEETLFAQKLQQSEELRSGPKRLLTTPLGVTVLPNVAADLRKRPGQGHPYITSPGGAGGSARRAAEGAGAASAARGGAEGSAAGGYAAGGSAASACARSEKPPLSTVGGSGTRGGLGCGGAPGVPSARAGEGRTRSEASYPATPRFSQAGGDDDTEVEVLARMERLEKELAAERQRRTAVEERLRALDAGGGSGPAPRPPR